MDKTLRILHLEDDADFTAIVAALLEQENLKIEIVHATDYPEYLQALELRKFDLILADFLLPSCNGLQALEVAREKRPDTPFLIVSGAINEFTAIESLRNGATDYVLKSKLERLFPAVRRAVQEAAERAQRKHAETELVRREKYFRALTENSLDVLSILDREGRFLYNSPSLKTVLGMDPKDLAGCKAFDLVHPDDVKAWHESFQRALQDPELRLTTVFRYLHADGSWHYLETVCKNRLDDPEIAGVVLNSRDVTERKLAAEALAKSEANLAAAQRIAFLGSWELELADSEKMVRQNLYWSDETYRIFGLEPGSASVTNDLFFQLVHPEDRAKITEIVSHALRSIEPYEVEYRITHQANNEERTVRERGEIVCNESQKPVRIRGIVMDITERKRLEVQLRQSQKMEAIGQLAGGVAHDFNNILTVIHGHASLLLHSKNLPVAGQKSVQQITQAAERAASLTRQLLTFSRRQVLQPRQIDLNELVSNMTMMLGRLLGEDITLQLNYWPQPACLRADSGMMEQILLNLAVNARDAMPKGGQLAIRISAVEITPTRAAWHPDARPGGFICLSVADNGCGISPDNLSRIFEPFFTTKEIGKGTGLGLATVFGIVKQHKGWIEVKSELGKGTMFRVYLPACAKPAEPAAQTGEPPAVRGGTETILVVEDEPSLRELVCNVLAGHGYKVLQAENGAKALALWNENHGKVDLLLTDLIMPEQVSGRELARQLQSECPDLKVILTSGYTPEAAGKDFVSSAMLRYLQKPYEPRKLAEIVRDSLDAEARTTPDSAKINAGFCGHV